jgi:hypothetical protein
MKFGDNMQNEFLKRINKADSIEEIILVIKSFFETDDEYIPAIIDEGNFTEDEGEDFYLKLVLKHASIPIKTTWLKNNLAFHLEEPDEEGQAYIHNVIVYRRYKSRNLYQLNPLLVTDEISEYEYTNSAYVNAYFNDEYSNIQGVPVLKLDDDENLLLLKKVLKDYINDPTTNIYPKFQLVAEFEYRTHQKQFNNVSKQYSDAYIRVDRNENKNLTFVLGSVVLPLLFKNDEHRSSREIKVIDLHSLTPRSHNPNHFDGDMVEGFVCFKPGVLDILKEHYYFYDLHIIEKSNINNEYLVDVLDDKVVFWEAEYNKLPTFIKDLIDPFNFIPSDESFISRAMAAMQLEVDWHWDKKLSPDQKLASVIRERYFNRAIDMGLSFIPPKNFTELKDFILKIESLTGVKLENFNVGSEDVRNLISIRDNQPLSTKIDNLSILYKKYCYAIQKVFEK